MVFSTLSLLIAAGNPPPPAKSFEVTEVHREISFAGKLGDRVDLRFSIRVGDHTDRIEVGRQHTRFGKTLQLAKGDRVQIREFRDVPNQIVMSQDIQTAPRT